MGWKEQTVTVADAVDRVIETGCNAVLLISGLALLVLLNLVVVLRYVFAAGLGFAPDITEILFAIFVMAGIAQAARVGAHVATQLLMHSLHGKWRLSLIVLLHSVTAFVYLLLAWYGARNAVIASDQLSPVLHIPLSVGYGCLSIGLALIAVCSIVAILRHWLDGERFVTASPEPIVSIT